MLPKAPRLAHRSCHKRHNWRSSQIPQHIRGWGDTDYHHIKHAPELKGVTQLGMFHQIARAAAKRHILIMMVAVACSPRSKRKEKPGGLWYDPDFSEKQVNQ